jgi:hypothetical protein
MWVRLDLPSQEWDRLLGFSIPQGEDLILVTYDGIVRVRLGTPMMASLDERYPKGDPLYDLTSGELRYDGQTYQIIGVHGGIPILHNQWGERIVLDVEEERETSDGRRVRATPEESTLLIQAADGISVLAFTFRNFSRDWQRATFSRDGMYIALGMPYEIYVFRRATGRSHEPYMAAR